MQLGIVGLGRLGQLWAKALSPFGEIIAYDSKPSDTIMPLGISLSSLARVAQAELLFLTVPIAAFATCCQMLKPYLSPDTLIVDCCSVKVYPVAVMKQVFASNQPIIATHPLFGPVSVAKSGSLAQHKIVVCLVQASEQQQQQFLGLLTKLGLTILISTPEQHDQQMATSQSLVHYLGRSLALLPLQAQQLATPDYQALLHLSHMAISDSEQLFLDMHRYNPYTGGIREKLLAHLKHLDAVIREEIPDENLNVFTDKN